MSIIWAVIILYGAFILLGSCIAAIRWREKK